MRTHRELIPPGGRRKERTAEQIGAAARSALDYPATQVGVIGNITVSYDPGLGSQGLALAQQMLNVVSAPYDDMQTFFGIAGGTVNVVIAPLSGNNDGSGGAYHYGCDFRVGGVLYLDATFASTTVDPLDLEVGLYVAELSESFMGPQNKGWNCGSSNGEALSRFCAEQETPDGTLDAFVTGPAWDKAGRPDWINKTEGTDRDDISIGCGIVYIYWMRWLGFTISQITQAGGATFADNYKTLTGKASAYQDLLAAVKNLTITSDNPFPLFQTRIFESATTFVNETDGTWLMADFDGDEIPDLVFIKTNNTSNGHVEVHIASGASNYQTPIFESATTFVNETDGTWLMADYDGDGVPDLVFIKTNNTPNGHVEVHIASAASNYQTRTFESATTFANENDGTWLMADHDVSGVDGYDLKSSADRAFAFDYDGSGKLDHLVLYRPGTGTIWILKNTVGNFAPVYQQGDPGIGIGGYDLSSTADRAFAFDYDGSGKLDHLVLYRPGTGTIWILKNTAGNFAPVYQQGDPGIGIGGYDLSSTADRAFAFDYDGSGKLDHLVLYRPGTGTIWILKNTAGNFAPVYQQGAPGNGIGGYDLSSTADRVFAFDYEGSGKLDHLVLYRPGTGTIWILENTDGNFAPVYRQGAPGNGIGGYDLKSAADRAFAFDYDGTGKLNHLVLYRPGTGTIWILKNTVGNFAPVYHQGDPGTGIGGYDLKSLADLAFSFDYDGSGKLDHLVLYRPGTGIIWILKNTVGNFTPVHRNNFPDLVFIKTNNTPNGHVEVHIASGESNYQTRILEVATTFANETDGTWLMADYDRDGIADLVFIKTNNTPNGHVEVHIASAVSNYQTRVLEVATTFTNETDGTWLMADYDRGGSIVPTPPDLVFIKTNNTPNGHVEVHIASGA